MQTKIQAAVIALSAAAALSAQSAPALPSASTASVQAMADQYCLACHNDELKTGSVSLTGVQTTQVGAHADLWEKVLRKVRTGEMPPLGMPRPEAAEAQAVVTWLEKELDQAAAAHPDPGTPSIHRLNRVEYSNAVRDLLALDLDHSASLPADNSGYGFDNIGDVLTVSPLHMEKYMAAARRVSRLAVGTVKASAAIEKYAPDPTNEGSDGLPVSVRDGMLIKRYFPLDAEYSILVRVRGDADADKVLPKLDVRVDGRRVKLFDVAIDPAEEAQHTRNYEIRLPLAAGMHELGAGFLEESSKPERGVPAGRGFFRARPPNPVSVDYLLVGGPFDPTGPGETPSRKGIFVCRPAVGENEEPCAKEILSSLARRAYRRPVEKADIEPLMELFATGRQDGGSFDAGIEMALRAILVSPNFLFRVEPSVKGSEPGSIRRTSDLELASRLSFFLWSSIPDDELLQLAEQNKLRPALEQQVRRMLAHPKAKALVDNFAGQWLLLRNITTWSPDPEKYPKFDKPLGAALQKETELFVEHIIREDRSVLEFLDADYSFLNERLAEHYGISGVRGDYFRPVTLRGNERGGVLTQGGILMVTSYPTRTSPVLRGKWILENILGAPPPPPPANVPDLADSASVSAKDLRAALEQHRASAGCASCHARLDPLGFALENYDGTGKFRTKEGDSVIDASGSLPGGIAIDGPNGLKKVLMERHDEFVECLAEKLLTYALGRGLEYYDMPAVREIRRRAAQSGYRFSSIALAIVEGVPFQMRRTPER
jgi:mono/diheme cytochrome c family protein